MTDKPTQLFIELAYFILYFNQAWPTKQKNPQKTNIL
jgi:hypothetical protein